MARRAAGNSHMSVATTVGDALAFEEVDFEILRHVPTYSAAHTARAMGVDPRRLAKAVLLKDANGYVLAVLPANHALDVPGLSAELHRALMLAAEEDLDELFCDCAIGSVPPLGSWYRIPTVVDSALKQQADIYFEAGDHRCLVHVTETGFEQLVGGADYFTFSHPA
jgi:Ala-tRNA(Pro) deacylase